MNSNQTPNKATGTATELNIKDLFEEVGRMVYVFWREYEAWALGHRTDQELENVQSQWQDAVNTLISAFTAEEYVHITARRETRERYRKEKQQAREANDVAPCDRCGECYPTRSFKNVEIAPADNYYLCPACCFEVSSLLGLLKKPQEGTSTTPEEMPGPRVFNHVFKAVDFPFGLMGAVPGNKGSYMPPIFDLGLDLVNAQAERPTEPEAPQITTNVYTPATYDEFGALVNEIGARAVERAKHRAAEAPVDRTKWPLVKLLSCPCSGCKAELERRKAQALGPLKDETVPFDEALEAAMNALFPASNSNGRRGAEEAPEEYTTPF